MTTYPDWVRTLDENTLQRRFGHDTLERGRRYADEGRLQRIRRADNLVMAAVRGSQFQTYQTSVVCQAGPASLVATCTCPVRRDCKHAAALIVHMREAQPRREVSGWQQVLDPLLTRAASARGGTPLALQVDDDVQGISLRPLRLGARNTWVKSGATWADLRGPEAASFDQAQLAALVGLLESRRRNDFYYGHRVDALPLAELRPDAWGVLERAVTAGVRLLGGEDRMRRRMPDPLLASEPFVPAMRVDRADEGLRVTPALAGNEEIGPLDGVSFIGRPPHGVSAKTPEGRLVLSRLSRPLDQAEARLFEGGAMAIPAADIPLFAAGFLPQLQDRLAVRVDPELDLPTAQPPRLLCRVTFSDRRAQVAWGFAYRVGTEVHELGVRPAASDPPLRDAGAEAALAASVPQGPWRTGGALPELHETTVIGRGLIAFTTDVLPGLLERDDVDVTLTGEPPTFTEAEEAPRVELTVTDSEVGDWFDLGVEVWVGDERVPFGMLFAALSVGQDHLILESGTWFDLAIPELEELRALIDEARELVDHDGDTFHLRPEHAGLWEELVGLGVVGEQSAAWQEAVTALLDVESLPEVAPPVGLRAELRPYQLTGFRWLSLLWRSRLGGILADEMGLGKTLQALAMAQSAFEAGELERPMLVVAPTSVIGTWASEAARFTPDLRVVAVDGTVKRRGHTLAEAIEGAHVVVTSYTLLRLEADAYAEQPWSAVMLDEAQFVKNHSSQAYKAVRRLRARMKVALTGTPLENNLMDLWSLLSITAPGLFVDPKTFTDTYRKPIENGDAEVLARLHRRIRPLILRRTKAAVAKELPDKQEQVLPIELSPAHRKLYDKHLARERQKVLGLVGDLARNRITILRSLTLLRQLALAPVLVDESYPEASAKVDALVERLGEVISEGHRALVFSQFTGFLGLVRRRLEAEGIALEYLDGRTRDRAARIASFREGEAPVFLISLKAGGFGLTLTEADYVFILDPWWNPAAESQAVDRTHRIGQDKPVNVYRLVAADTIEEKVVALQETKRHLFDQVVGQASDIAAPLSAADIRGLLDA
ncbi:DEAD/DEAH box helicase [Propioniciclava soli]|uniref:DEAD/DEAH box helicase n=1 Tax=Propioniciclava soli TaxID=2775081 RepID=UPI001E2FB85D|nr:DEAD/DEAH box helicase [Propioniciclava soli]